MRKAWISAACNAATASSNRAESADCSANDHSRATSVSVAWRGAVVGSDDDGRVRFGASAAANSAPVKMRRTDQARTTSNPARTHQNAKSATAAKPLRKFD